MVSYNSIEILMKNKIILFLFLLQSSILFAQKTVVLNANSFKNYIDYFNTMELETIKQAIPNDSAWQWLKKNIPLFNCPQQNFEEIYYYRWWTFRKHIKNTDQGKVITEFLVNRSYADKYNLIASGLGHHIYESRWLHDKTIMNNNLKVWYRGNDGQPLKKLRFYSSWNIDAIYNRYLVNGDAQFINDILPDLKQDFLNWENEKLNSNNGLYWQYDVRDAMEETISGGRKEKNGRPSIHSYMYGNCIALANLYEAINDKNEWNVVYQSKAEKIKEYGLAGLWNKKNQFFEVRKDKGDTLANVREAIGYLPWYFNMADAQYDTAWKYLMDTKHFCAPFGITTADRSHPQFRTHGCCNCEWDGAVWPFATAQTLTALANVLNQRKVNYVNNNDYFNLLQTYVESQYYRGKPYIGEYLDEKTGYWLKGDQERSKYYNHSTFNDLIISGLIGIRPRADQVLEINPLIPQQKWDWFCLDNVLYHNKIITIIWDKDGTKYNKGKGFSIFINGKKMTSKSNLQKVEIKF
jgi:hypothetical protein